MPSTPSKKPDRSGAGRGIGRVAFLAHLQTIVPAIQQGHPLKGVFDEHQEKLGISYAQFTRYVARYVKSPEANERIPVPPYSIAPPVHGQGQQVAGSAAGGGVRSGPGPQPAAAAPRPTPAPSQPASRPGSGAGIGAGQPDKSVRQPTFKHSADSSKSDDLI